MRFWILVGGGVLVLAAAIWPFGSSSPEPTFPAVVKDSRTPESHKPEPAKSEPPKVIEMIDLSRAYEPVREREEVIDPATFIEVLPPVEKVDVMPRDAVWQLNGLMNFIPTPEFTAGKIFIPNNPPYHLISPNAVAQAKSAERLDVMPREIPENLYEDVLDKVRNEGGGAIPRVQAQLNSTERLTAQAVPARFVVEDPAGKLLHYVEAKDEAVVRVSGLASPVEERLTQPIPKRAFVAPLIPVERLTVEPRVQKR
jgi:hypothetical protein